jgi:hypothetical protein
MAIAAIKEETQFSSLTHFKGDVGNKRTTNPISDDATWER